MTYENQYEKDVAYIAKIDRLLSKEIEFWAYCVAFVACLAAHVTYFTLFWACGVWEMAVFNVGSILFYVSTILLVKRVKEKLNLVYAALAEIIAHATLATVFVGGKPNFAMFLLMIIPIAFLMPNKRKAIPFVIMGISMALYIALCFLDHPFAAQRREFEQGKWAVIFLAINAVIGVFVLVYVTYIYTLINLYQESKLRVQNEQLRIMASIDPLTKLNNRRAMGEVLKRIGSESDRSGKSYVLGLGDIDNFKKVNDTYGHDQGDLVLEEVANVIREMVPESGCAARWGGEEFLFVIPDSSLQEVAEKTEEILRTIRQREFKKAGESFFVTMTVGLSECKGLDGVEAAISKADQFLYYGKNHGKDQVVYDNVP